MITGNAFKTWALLLVGNVFLVVLAVRAVGSWMKKEWGEFVALIVGAVVVVGFVYFPDQTILLLQNIWKTFVR